jgi:predicted Rossmann-fold nucleotide-binding protein
MKIAVYGSAVAESEELTKSAKIIGEEIFKSGSAIITGACKGLPFDAAEKVKSLGGFSIGYSAVTKKENHENALKTPLTCYDELVLIPESYKHRDNLSICLKYRNVSSVADCDAAIFISGRWGTLNEFAITYDAGKIIGVLTGSGKFTSQVQHLIEFFGKETKGTIIFDDDPRSLVQRVIKQFQNAAL